MKVWIISDLFEAFMFIDVEKRNLFNGKKLSGEEHESNFLIPHNASNITTSFSHKDSNASGHQPVPKRQGRRSRIGSYL